jgi:Reductase C-terminal
MSASSAGHPSSTRSRTFSDQYEIGMEYSGYATEWDEVIYRGAITDGEFIAFWLKDQRVIAGMNVNVWDVNEDVQRLIRARREINPAALGDQSAPLATGRERRAWRSPRSAKLGRLGRDRVLSASEHDRPNVRLIDDRDSLRLMAVRRGSIGTRQEGRRRTWCRRAQATSSPWPGRSRGSRAQART